MMQLTNGCQSVLARFDIHWLTASLRVKRFILVVVALDNQGKENSMPCLISSSTLLTSAILSLAVTFDEVRNGTSFSILFPLSIMEIRLRNLFHYELHQR